MTPDFLGVSKSLTGRRWVGPELETERRGEALEQATGLPRPMCLTLARLRVASDDVAAYLAPSIRALLPDPAGLRDMEPAAERFLAAVESQQPIAVFADYDVDGGASAALIIDWLAALGQTATLYVPDRIDEGYGPNEVAMAALAKDHALIICVDCGTLAHGPIEAAAGADVIVLDHHLGGETLPKALAVVNPNRQDEPGDLGHLCAAGVVFLFLVEVNRRLRARDGDAPDLMGGLDLVGLATVADVAPLVGVNRAFVRQGLRVMGGRGRPGLAALGDVARLTSAPNAYHLGYVLGPRINAGGRVGRADLGARLLLTRDPAEAAAIAERLDQYNAERRDIETAVRDVALEQTAARTDDQPLAWAAGDGWHPGVVGIVAARIKETTGKPSVVIGFDGDHGRGSGRSVPGVDLGAIVQQIAGEGLIERGGGHKMAAGLSLNRDQLKPAMARIAELIAKQPVDFSALRELRVDGALMAQAATVELIEKLQLAGPFGAGAPAPRFAFPAQKIAFAKEVGSGHLKLTARDGAARLEAIAFGAFSTDLGPELLAHEGRRFHLVGRLDVNTWRGRESVQLQLEDAALAVD